MKNKLIVILLSLLSVSVANEMTLAMGDGVTFTYACGC